VTVLFDDPVDMRVGGGGVVDIESFRWLRPQDRDTALMDVEVEIRRLHALQAAMISEVDTSQSFLADGHRSVRNWFQAVINCSPATAAYEVRVAAMFAFLPEVATAARLGELGADQIRLLAGLYANPRVRGMLPDWAGRLVGFARDHDQAGLRTLIGRWSAHADPDGAHRDHELSRDNRRVTRSRVGVGQVLSIEGDAYTGEILNNILDAHAHAEFLDDVAANQARYGDQANSHALPRTAAQRLYDAVVAIFHKAAGTDQTTDREPLVTIVVSQADCEHAIRHFFGGTDTAPAGGVSERMRYCQTTTGTQVDPHDLVIAVLLGRVRRVVVDDTGRVTHLGRRRRLFTGAVREAVLLFDNTCDMPGCGIHGPGLHIDHIHEWARSRDGTTDPDNGRAACNHHNQTKTRLKHTVTHDQHGWHHYRPDGTEITPRYRNPNSP